MKIHQLISNLGLAAVIALAACGGDDATTGRRVVLQTRIVADVQAGVPFESGTGWSITLKQALVATGPIYYFDGAPAISQRGPLDRFIAALAPISTAHAHPGHYAEGRAKGNVTQPFSADLLAGATMLPAGVGITGLVRSGTFSFAAPSAGPAAAALSGHAVVVAGTATSAGRTVNFVFNADLADVARTAKDAAITGCVFAETDIEADGTVAITVKPRVWFNLVDFGELAPGSEAAPTVIGKDTTAHIAFALGLAQLSAYQFAYGQP